MSTPTVQPVSLTEKQPSPVLTSQKTTASAASSVASSPAKPAASTTAAVVAAKTSPKKVVPIPFSLVASAAVSKQQHTPAAGTTTKAPLHVNTESVSVVAPAKPTPTAASVVSGAASATPVTAAPAPTAQTPVAAQQPPKPQPAAELTPTPVVPPTPKVDRVIINKILSALSTAYQERPLPIDGDIRHEHKPANPTSVPAYFPTKPVINLADDPNLVSKLSNETLFFIFYFEPGMY